MTRVHTIEPPRIGYKAQSVFQVVLNEFAAAAHCRDDDHFPFLWGHKYERQELYPLKDARYLALEFFNTADLHFVSDGPQYRSNLETLCVVRGDDSNVGVGFKQKDQLVQSQVDDALRTRAEASVGLEHLDVCLDL